jgi:O-antigen/teichoic acid export membrane protein
MELPAQSLSANAASVVRRATKGALALGLRQIVVQGVNVLGGVLLARLLTPAEFGVFGIFTFVLSFLGTLGDVGLGASLVRAAEDPDEHDYRVIFTAQQLLVGTVVAVFWIASPWITEAYNLPSGHRWLFRAVALSLFAASFQTVPSIRLERRLAFQGLAVAEVAQTFVYNGLAVGLAWTGLREKSFVIAIVARSVVGACVIQLVSRWRIAWEWDWPLVKRHLAFGLPYQGISVVSLIKDSITPIMVGLLAGAAAVGYINWAQMVAAYAVMALMVFQRIYLPMFARLQSDPHALGAVVERVVWMTNAICAPLSVLTLVLFEPLTAIVFGPQWLAAKNLFLLLWVANLFVPSATPMLGLLSALGHSRMALLFAVIWMLGTWLVGAPLIYLYGGIGFAVANFVVQFSNVALCYVAKAKVPFKVLVNIAPAWAAAAGVGALTFLLRRRLPPEHVPGLVTYVLLGVAAYVGVLKVVDREAFAKARALFMGTS